jgi:hypothetical protein
MAAHYAHTCEGRDDSIVLPNLVQFITPRNVLDDSACRPINPNVEKIVGIIHNNDHYAVMEIAIANKIAHIYDGLGIAPLLTWSQHIINALQMCQLVCVTAITSTVGDQPQLIQHARTRNMSPLVLSYSIMLDHEEWRLERGGFVAQTDGYYCGPIACLKILEMYSLVSVLDVKVAYSLNGLRRLAMDKWRLFIDYCNKDLVVRRRFDVAIEEPHPMPGMPEQSFVTMATIKESEIPMVAAVAAALSRAQTAEMDICICCADDISMELIEMKCCKKPIHRQCILVWLAVSNQCVYCCGQADTLAVVDYPVKECIAAASVGERRSAITKLTRLR